MTEILHSREYRQQELKSIIKDLHKGVPAEEVKERFKALIKDVGAAEIANLEQELIKEGLPEQEIKKLCDVHVSIFKDSLDEQVQSDEVPGHPVYTFRAENRAIGQLVEQIQNVLGQLTQDGRVEHSALKSWTDLHSQLMQVEKHYSRKENVLFPYLEKYGISGPPSVMWSIHDDIRAQMKQVSRTLEKGEALQPAEIGQLVENIARPMLTAIKEMAYKEDKILFPMSLETLTEAEWQEIYRQSDEIGYTLIEPERKWTPKTTTVEPKKEQDIAPDALPLDTGALTLQQVNAMLKTLPVDITFVDKDNTVRYYSQGKERIFTRTKAIIGRQVEMCHPPESVHVVAQIVDDFRAGKRESADFWIEMGGKFIYIRYFPVRDDTGNYLGVLEVSQDATEVRSLTGQRRILDDPSQE